MKLFTKYPTMAMVAIVACMAQTFSHAQTINVNSIQEIQDAMANAQPGDEIVIASGTYRFSNSDKIPGAFGRNCYLHSDKDGTGSNRITLRGASGSNKPVIEGVDYNDGYLLSLEGDYWIIKDIEFKTGSKGVILDDADYTDLIGLEIHDVGEEALHFRHGTTYSVADDCFIHDTGKNPDKTDFGEGVYCGSDRSVQNLEHNGEDHPKGDVFCPDWKRDQGRCGRFYNPFVHDITIKNSKIGPNITAEPFDIREGSCQVIIENNIIDGKGQIDKDFQDSFIDLKGIYCYVRYNTFNQNGTSTMERAIAVLNRDDGNNLIANYTSKLNVIHDNVFNMDDEDTPVLNTLKNTSQTYMYSNTRNPDGKMFTGFSGTTFINSDPGWGSINCPMSEDGSSVLAVNEFSKQDDFFLVPNPATSVISIVGLTSLKSASLYSLQGQEILAVGVKNLQNNQLDISNIAAGTYLLQATTEKGVSSQLFTKK